MQGLDDKDNYEAVFIWSSQHCQLELSHRKTTTSVDDSSGWQHKLNWPDARKAQEEELADNGATLWLPRVLAPGAL